MHILFGRNTEFENPRKKNFPIVYVSTKIKYTLNTNKVTFLIEKTNMRRCPTPKLYNQFPFTYMWRDGNISNGTPEFNDVYSAQKLKRVVQIIRCDCLLSLLTIWLTNNVLTEVPVFQHVELRHHRFIYTQIQTEFSLYALLLFIMCLSVALPAIAFRIDCPGYIHTFVPRFDNVANTSVSTENSVSSC